MKKKVGMLRGGESKLRKEDTYGVKRAEDKRKSEGKGSPR